MKVLIVGCNGLLGQNLISASPNEVELAGCGLEEKPFAGGIPYRKADLGKRNELLEVIEKIQPDWIFNVAAMTNVDLCEKEISLCQKLNRDAVAWMAETYIPMVHISTDYVFDGKAGPYREEDLTHPLGVYGRVKLESEAPVLSNINSIVVRTMTLWGNGVNLRPSFVEFVRSNLAAKKEIRIVTDQLGNPTLASDLAGAIWKLIENKCSGIYHAAGSELLTRYDWAKKIAAYYRLSPAGIHACTTEKLGQTAKRPLNSGLVCDKLRQDTGYELKNAIQQLGTAS